MKKLTIIGGGTGSFVVLSGLKKYDLDLTAIVTMTDSGGSTGRLRDQLGVLPPGDLRQCLVALSEASDLWRKLFLYRFESGDLEGHNFGNIFLSALEKVSDEYDQVIQTASYVLQTKGKVLPVTLERSTLCVEYENGQILKGESQIDENVEENTSITRAFLEPQVKTTPLATQSLKESDYIIISPGDLYTSIVPVLLVDGVKQSIQQSKAKIMYIMNLMTKQGQTSRYSGSQFIQDLETYLGRKPDIMIVNDGKIPQNILQWYEEHNEQKVEDDLETIEDIRVIRSDIVNRDKLAKPSADALTRSILRHDPERLSKLLYSIITK